MKETIKLNTSQVSSAEDPLKSLTQSLESFKNMMSESVSSSFIAMIKSYSTASKSELNSVTESLGKTLNTYANISMSNLKSNLLADSISTSLQEMVKPLKLYDQPHVSESLKSISESISLLSESILPEQLRQLSKIDYSALFANTMSESSTLTQIVNTTYSVVQDELLEDDEQDEDFTDEEIQEIFQEQVSNPIGFQERISNWTEKKIVKYYIIWQLICFIYGNFFQPYFQENVGIPVTAYIISNVKELPQKGSEIICQLKEGIEAIITEDANYYYKVSFIDESGEEREGYVAKRNLKKIEE